MNYQRPEVVPLGSATALIQGSKGTGSESVDPKKQLDAADSELDD
jgi:hypothetical protein